MSVFNLDDYDEIDFVAEEMISKCRYLYNYYVNRVPTIAEKGYGYFDAITTLFSLSKKLIELNNYSYDFRQTHKYACEAYSKFEKLVFIYFQEYDYESLMSFSEYVGDDITEAMFEVIEKYHNQGFSFMHDEFDYYDNFNSSQENESFIKQIKSIEIVEEKKILTNSTRKIFIV